MSDPEPHYLPGTGPEHDQPYAAQPQEDGNPGPDPDQAGAWDIPGPPDGDPGWGNYIPAPVGQFPGPAAPVAFAAPAMPRHRPGRRTLTFALVITAALAAGGAGAAYATGVFRAPATHHLAGPAQHRHDTRPAAPAITPPALTRAQAQQVLTRYLDINNRANPAYNAALLHTVEGGSSYLMDAGGYRFERAAPRKAPYTPFTLTHPAWYIPRFPATAYPRWFAVEGTDITSTGKTLGTAFLVFSKATAQAPWKEVSEPYVQPARTPVPAVALDSGGYATAISTTAKNTAGLAIAPDQTPQVTATSLDHLAAMSSQIIAAHAQSLTDLTDEVFWRSGHGGTAINATDHHAPARFPVYGLKTSGGGALLFYTLRATLQLTAPRGTAFRDLYIPGYYHITGHTKLRAAAVIYIEQFATWMPPAGGHGSQIIADSSGIAARGN